MDILKTQVFDKWFAALKDRQGRALIQAKIDRLEFGSLSDVKPVGQGVQEIRIFNGPGYRVYFKRYGETLVILLAGGDKSTQRKDIRLAKNLAKQLERLP